MCSSLVTQQMLAPVTAVNDGFQVTSARAMWSNRLIAWSWPSKPGAHSISGLSNSRSANARLIGWPGRVRAHRRLAFEPEHAAGGGEPAHELVGALDGLGAERRAGLERRAQGS
jgi:hypothetical protein